jgi:superfamily II DNA/RNA helicase
MAQSKVSWSVAARWVLATEHVSDKLRQHGIAAAALHDQVSTGRRAQAPSYFASGLVEVLVPPTWPLAGWT